ncbi:MAG: TonB-dependent receptor plug domain-containing protein [Flavobacteriales bacterium]|nr:TonB-dependent receptor plug domain-containing protein [Flavobacteriales bacterium]
MVKNSFLLLAALFIGGHAHSQQGFLGKVIDVDSGEPIYGLTVVFEVAGDTVYTNALGEFYVDVIAERSQSSSYSTLYLGGLSSYTALYTDTLNFVGGAYGQRIPMTIDLKAEDLNAQTFELTARFQQLVSIPEAAVISYEDESINHPMSTVRVRPQQLATSDQSSLQIALNDVPGVRFESRGNGGSRRLNIRGSMLRSPFAVRNVKIFYDDFTLTSPDGQSSLELLDPQNIGEIVIVKGSAASVYGAGTGGVLIAKSPDILNRGNFLRTSLSFGSFNYVRSASELNIAGEDIALRLSHSFQETEGYREQEANKRQQFDVQLAYKLNNTLDYKLWAVQYQGKWGLPGGINEEQASDNPRQARPYAVENNTHVNRTRQRIGISQRWTKRRFTNTTSAFINNTSKINPYGTSNFFNGYKNEKAQGGGIRNVFKYRFVDNIDNKPFKLKARLFTEFTREDNQLDEFDNDGGKAGELRYENETLSQEFTGGLTLFAEFKKLFIQTGATYSLRTINTTNDIQSAQDSVARQLTDRSFDGFLPFFRVSVEYLKNQSIYAGVSAGVSPPSLFELLDPGTGVISESLEAEEALNLDFGLRGSVKNWMSYDVGAYQTQLQNGIREFEDSTGTFFVNGNDQLLRGLEGRLNFNFYVGQKGLYAWGLSLNGALQRLQFESKSSDEIGPYVALEIEDKYLPGSALAMSGSNLWIEALQGVRLNINWQWTDRMPANEANTVWLASYHLVNLHLDVRMHDLIDMGPWSATLSGGVQNLLDTEYSSFVAFNAFGGRFFNPSPETNYYGALSVRRNF